MAQRYRRRDARNGTVRSRFISTSISTLLLARMTIRIVDGLTERAAPAGLF